MSRGLFAFVLVAAACSTSINNNGVDGGAGDQACPDTAMVRCAKRQSCSNGARLTRDFGDMNTCLQREKLGCLAGLNAPSTGQSATHLEGCVAAYASLSCADFFTGNLPAACVATGTIAQGAGCAFNGQCASTYCVNNKLTGCGQCGSEPVTGASCANDFCARGTTCLPSTMTCVVEGTAGIACNRTNPCAPGFSCMGATMTAMGACQTALGTAGTTCDPKQQTTPGCDANLGLACNTTTKMCQAIAYVGDGQPCGLLADGSAAGCSGGGLCVIATGQTMGTCKAPAADGAACDTAVGPPCLAPARCITGGAATTNGTCGIPDATLCH